jgi:predicted NAD/FAD-binding protein
MPRDYDHPPRRLDIAVIGTGVAGLSAAWLLSKGHNVSVYEQDGRIGGHSNTVLVPGSHGTIAVDTGFIVYNELNYPNLTALFAHLGVATQQSEMSFAVSLDRGALEYSGSDLMGLFGQRRNVVRPRFWRMLRDIRRFYREAPAVLAEGDAALSLGDYLDREGYSQAFVDDHLLPMGAAIWSTDAATMRDHPAQAFVRFCLNHGLMRVTGRPQWRTVTGGSRAYIDRLSASFSDRIMVNARVGAITRSPAGVIVHDANGAVTRFDHVVIAAHADQALDMLADPSGEEQRLLGSFRYSRNTAILHRDESLMPRRRRVWSSWNYIGGSGGAAPAGVGKQVCVTYWMNRLQSLDASVPLFVTLNPTTAPAPAKVIKTFEYHHPMYDAAALAAQGQLGRLQGRQNTWFCGSYFGSGFHEDALSSGLAVGEALGGTVRPWFAPAAEPEALNSGLRSVAE